MMFLEFSLWIEISLLGFFIGKWDHGWYILNMISLTTVEMDKSIISETPTNDTKVF